MNPTPSPAEITQSITTIPKSDHLKNLKPFIPHLTPPIILSIISSKSLSTRPIPSSHSSNGPIPTSPPSPSLQFSPLSSLFSFNKFTDAKSLLTIPLDQYIEQMKEFDCLSDNVTYNTLLVALCRKGKLNEVRDLSADMKSKGLLPDRNTYNTLVCGYCKMGWLKDAANIIELMSRSNMLPNTWTYNTLLNGLCSVGRIEEAIRLRDEMEGLKLSPDVVTYNILINSCLERADSS